ncbi:type 1 fimbria pilin [Enterobacter sp. BIGb0383]|nr:type 1 fimbria pilin [Enterobacter sp. BIGb0383]ROS06740.1 type 1 fimbria pilin [Enterobacter sp. BIGb0359]
MPVMIRVALLFAALSLPAWSYDVLVSVTGRLTGSTCVLSTDSEQQTVQLGAIGTKQFSGETSVSNITTPFTLKLEDCGTEFAGVKIRFRGSADGKQRLKIASGGATGVAVNILDKNGAMIPVDTMTTAYGTAGEESVEMTFYAQLVANGDPVTPGSVSAVAIWTMEYQ